MSGSANPIATKILSALFLGVGTTSFSFADVETTRQASANKGSVAWYPDEANSPPGIAGAPPASVEVHSTYDFRPVATDAEGDPLVFEITNKPSWADFDASTGSLHGVPTQQHAGYYKEVGISVSDGYSLATTPAFDIEVVPQYAELPATGSIEIGWRVPLENEDGTSLIDLAGYRIYYGRRIHSLRAIVELRNPGLNQYRVERLPLGVGHFAMTALNSAGAESALSRIVTQEVR